MADFATRSTGIGYAGGSALLLPSCSPHCSRGTGRRGTISVDSILPQRAGGHAGGHGED